MQAEGPEQGTSKICSAKKREEVQRVRAQKQLNFAELRIQQSEEFQAKKVICSTVKSKEEQIRLAREAERARIEKTNEEM